MDTILAILLYTFYIGVIIIWAMISIAILIIPIKIIYTVYKWIFTSYGQMTLTRWSQGDFSDY